MKKQESNDKSSKKNISTNVVERSKPTGIAPRSIGIGNDITAYKDPSDKYSYPSNTISRGGEGGKGGQWGYSGSNNGQTKINPQVAKQITDKISSSESAIQNEIGRLKGLNPIASEETLRSAAIQELGIATFEELLELKSYQNNSISHTSPIQNTQTKIINEFVSKYGSGMNEANVGILLNNIKSISGGEVTGQSKELVKQVYSTWFQSNFGMDTANIKIFNDRCISIFGKPIEIGAFKSTEDLHGSIVSKFTSEYGMDAPNTGILLNKIKSETGAEASKSTKEMIKQKHAQWFVQKYTLDEYNMKILDKSCITLFTSPTNPSTAILKLSNILLDDSHVPYITSMMASNNCPNLIYLDLRDNFLGDYSASLLATSISKGEMPSLKVTHLEGNKITTNGIGHFVKALESPKVIDVSIVFEIANKSKSVIDFIEKGLKYAIKQHAQSKWEVDKIRSNVEGEKWKGCKDMALNVGMGLMSDAKTCLGFKSKEAIFACVTAEVGWELFRPETVDCYIETCKVAGEVYDDNCSIF